jgi:malonyl-CoA O-methyltransferase
MKAIPPTEPVEISALVESFGRAAKDYWRYAGVQMSLAKWLAEWLPEGRNGRALEIGAGSGEFTRQLLPWPGELVASDLAPAMCAAGRVALPRIDWRELAAEAPEGGPWDWIFSSAMLQWAAEPANLFAAWREQLAPGGRVLAGMFVAESLPELNALLGIDGPVRWRTTDEWRETLEAGGLRIVRDAAVKREFWHESAGAFMRSLHGVGAAPVRRVPPGQLRRILREYDRRHGGDAGVRATWTFYRFEAERAAHPPSFHIP